MLRGCWRPTSPSRLVLKLPRWLVGSDLWDEAEAAASPFNGQRSPASAVLASAYEDPFLECASYDRATLDGHHPGV